MRASSLVLACFAALSGLPAGAQTEIALQSLVQFCLTRCLCGCGQVSRAAILASYSAIVEASTSSMEPSRP